MRSKQSNLMKHWFHRIVLSRLWLTFLVLGLSFFLFAAGTLNLIYLFQANIGLLLNNGWQALGDGGAQQLAELLITGYLSLAAYVVFKTCEHRLSHWLAEADDDSHI